MRQFYVILLLLAAGLLTLSSCSLLGLESSPPTPTPVSTGPVQAAFSADTTSLSGSSWVIFTSHSTGGIKEWNWVLGNGRVAIGPEAKTYYNDDGYYTVTLTVEGWDGSTDTLTKPDYIYVYGCG